MALVGGLGLLALLGLGIWQLQRLDWKEGVLATISTRITETPVALPVDPTPEADAYRAVAMTGEVLPEELHVYWVTSDQGPGYRVVSPFRTDTGRRVLLDRGFVTAKAKLDPRSAGLASVTGNLLWPDEADSLTPAPDSVGNIWYARDVAAMAEHLGTQPLLVVARDVNMAHAVNSITPMPVSTQNIPNNHLQYAFTWFLLALVWAAMTGLFLLRSRKGASAQQLKS